MAFRAKSRERSIVIVSHTSTEDGQRITLLTSHGDSRETFTTKQMKKVTSDTSSSSVGFAGRNLSTRAGQRVYGSHANECMYTVYTQHVVIYFSVAIIK